MKKLIAAILIIATMLPAGGSVFAMTQAEVDQGLGRVQEYYNGGYYYEALAEAENLLNSGALSDETFSSLSATRESLLYAIDTVDEVYAWFDRIQSYCDSGLYYEARDELGWLAQTYALTPLEQSQWNAKKADADQGIINYTNKLKFDEISAYYNNGLYYEARDVLSSMNTSTMSADHRQLADQWSQRLDTAITNMVNEAEAAENRAKLSSFYVGCNVRQYFLWIYQRVCVVREINYNTGQVKVYWSQGYDENGDPSTNPFIDSLYLGIGTEEWCDPDSLIIM